MRPRYKLREKHPYGTVNPYMEVKMAVFLGGNIVVG